MRTRQSVHWLIPVLFVCTFSALALAQKKLSDKDLFQKAQTEFTAGKLDDDYAWINSARSLTKKSDKKYDELFTKLSHQLADLEASKGDQACKSLDLVACEEQLKKATSFGKTDAVARLDTTFNTQLGKVRADLNAALDHGKTDTERGLKELNDLTRDR